jgi:diguanylate cyclase (GGDEF)-like protein/PAS domain S-box-containing protein
LSVEAKKPWKAAKMSNSGDRREPIGTAINRLNEAGEVRLLLQRDLREAWAERQFDLAYQPQFNLFTNSVVAFEALLRWCHAVRGNVPPVEFIPVAEEAGLIDEIGQWVLEKACREATNWPDHIRVAVNLSAIQLRNATLPAIVAKALHSSGLPPSRLELEVTESSVIPADAACLAALHSIRSTGVCIVIDDFDIGYSALGYLVNFPFDKIKIDRFFTARLAKGADGHDTARAIVRAIIGLCKDLNITLLAEGVETLEQLMLLRDKHCTEIQGYLCGCPQPAAAIPGTLEKAPGLLREMSERGATEARAAQALWSESVPFSQIAEILNDIVIVTTPDLAPPGPSIIYVNPAFTRLTGYSKTEAIGKTPRILQGPGTSRATLDKIATELQGGRPVHEKVLNFGKSGAPYWLDLQIVALRDAAGAITHFAAIERDVTLDKRRLDELEYLADRDTLTGIPNRRAFLRAISSEIEAATQDGIATADGKGPCLIFIDVDHFKKINDEFGHPIGDAVLRGVADCLAENVRRVDILGRIGGEEFAVCMPAIDLQEAKMLAARLRSTVAGARLTTPAGLVKITVSIGVACFTPGESVEALTSRADAAMYAAKRAGRNRVRAASVS